MQKKQWALILLAGCVSSWLHGWGVGSDAIGQMGEAKAEGRCVRVSGPAVDELHVKSFVWRWESSGRSGSIDMNGFTQKGEPLTYQLRELSADELYMLIQLLKSEPKVGFTPKTCCVHAGRATPTPLAELTGAGEPGHIARTLSLL
jgi:hypothetical protein